MIHWLAHKFGWNHGRVKVWWQKKRLMVGFECDKYGKVSGVHESLETRNKGEKR